MKRALRWFLMVLLVLVVAGCWRLRFDTQILNLLPPRLKVVEGLKLYQDHFANNRELIVTLRTSDPQVAEAAAESLAKEFRAHTNLVETVRWRPVWFEDPTLSAELLGYIWFNQKPADFQNLADRLVETNLTNVLNTTKEKLATSFSPTDLARLAYDPFGLTDLPESVTSQIPTSMRDQNWFASEDGTYHVLFVQARSKLADYNEAIEWVNALQQMTTDWKLHNSSFSGVVVHYTGPPAFVAETSQGMRRDLTQSVAGTMVLIGLLFWLAYRSWRPLIWILILLTLILGGALAIGALFMGKLSVISLGFAGILLGIAVDYALVLYQASLANPARTTSQVSQRVGSGIIWSAITTAGAFLILRTAGFPGLSQLGTLVAIGIILGAVTMLTWFLRPLKLRENNLKIPHLPAFTRKPAFAWGGTVVVALFIAVGWFYKLPSIDYSGNALEPANSQAYAGLKEMEKELNQSEEPYLLVVQGATEQDVGRRLTDLNTALTNAAAAHQLKSFMLPLLLWPKPDAQAANRQIARALSERQQVLHDAAVSNGFSTNALVLANALLSTWRNAADSKGVFWPTNELSRWILQKVVARDTNSFLAMGVLYPLKGSTASAAADWGPRLPQDQTWLTGWQPLAGELLRSMTTKVIWMLAGVLVLLTISLWLAFRRWTEVWLGFATLGLSGLCLCAVMQLAGWQWNLLNVMALPLLLGAGVDYTILMQLALQRHRGDITATHREIGMALVLSCATAAIGFGSLAWASNGGLASLGRVCSVGICCAGFASVFLLPFWWRRFATIQPANSQEITRPPEIYSAVFWRIGLITARWVPHRMLCAVAEWLALIYWSTQGERREIVINNLLPVVGNDRAKAEAACRRLFRNFGGKLVDLWRCEAGLPAHELVAELIGAEIVLEVNRQKRGALLITPHLGNWEFGGYALAARGIKLCVVTLAEPGAELTQLRLNARARSGIETVVIGEDPFAFVEIVKRLQEGAIMALLLDRPPQSGATSVELFNQPFRAAMAAAELARASGCALIPGFLPRTERGYRVEILPEISYSRVELGERAARHQLTQQIMRVFESAIRQHPDQWYHFVPIWPEGRDAEQQHIT